MCQNIKLPFAAILTPATDDKPFFNRRLPFSKITWDDLAGVFSSGEQGRKALEDRPVAEAALVVLLLQIVVVALLLIGLPLWIFRRRGGDDKTSFSTACSVLGVFAALGFGYIVVEVGFIQRFTLYLGRPVIVFATILGTILLCSGLGSAYSSRFTKSKAPAKACLFAAMAVTVTALLTPFLLAVTLFWPLGLRIMLAVILTMPAGFFMGMPFPLLVKRLQKSQPAQIPWAWGVNGFASVTGSIGAVILGMTAGFTVVLIAGVVCYLLAAFLALRLRAS